MDDYPEFASIEWIALVHNDIVIKPYGMHREPLVDTLAPIYPVTSRNIDRLHTPFCNLESIAPSSPTGITHGVLVLAYTNFCNAKLDMRE